MVVSAVVGVCVFELVWTNCVLVSHLLFVCCLCLLFCYCFFFLMIRRPPRSTLDRSSAASDVYKRQIQDGLINTTIDLNGDLADGMYMVKVTAGDEVFTQRVVIQK